MKLLSTQVGIPRDVEWHGNTVSTGIFKSQVEGSIMLRSLNLDGDGQADLTVHGGINKAVYVYPSEHYPYWKDTLQDETLLPGAFGENFTTEGLNEERVSIGDTFNIGGALVAVSEPRVPCYKLGIRFNRQDMPRLFAKSMRTGFYLRVLEEGMVEAGNEIQLISKDEDNLTVSEVARLYFTDRANETLLAKAVSTAALSESWRAFFQDRLTKIRA